MRRLPVTVQVLIGASALGLALVVPSALRPLAGPGVWIALALVGLVTLLELVQIDLTPRGTGDRTSFTLGSLGAFFVLAMLGTGWALLAALVHGIVIMLRARSPWYKALLSISAVTCSMWAAARVMETAQWSDSPLLNMAFFALAAGAYVVVNHTIVLLAVALSSGQQLFRLWWHQYAWLSAQQWGLSVTGLSLGFAVVEVGWYSLLLLTPLVLIVMAYKRHTRSQVEHTQELEQFANQLITTLAAVVDARDAYTFGHSTHVARYSAAIAQELGYRPADLDRLRVGALLHDIGKVGIPESILFKPGKLEPWEYQLMKEHAAIGFRIVSQIERLAHAAEVIHQHHEWYNGQGYPRGLQSDEILADARIVGVADALESLMSDRPYRQGRSLPEALVEIRRWSGTQFDPLVVQALDRVAEREGMAFFVNSAALVDEAHAGLASAMARQMAAAAAPSLQ